MPEQVPDPTILTTEAQERMRVAERDYVDGQLSILQEQIKGSRELFSQRFDDMDRATRLLDETVNRTPTLIQTEILHVRELMDQRFNASERAVDAALAAQKEAAAKAEAHTIGSIDKLTELFRTENKALEEKYDDLKARQNGIEGNRAGQVVTWGIVVALVTVIVFVANFLTAK